MVNSPKDLGNTNPESDKNQGKSSQGRTSYDMIRELATGSSKGFLKPQEVKGKKKVEEASASTSGHQQDKLLDHYDGKITGKLPDPDTLSADRRTGLLRRMTKP